MLYPRMGFLSFLSAWIFCAAISVAGDARIAIAVAADSQEINGWISQTAGRALYFLVFDENGNFLESAANPYSNAARGSGRQAALFLADKKISVVIAGRFGPRMKTALENANIKYLEQDGKILDAVKSVSHAD